MPRLLKQDSLRLLEASIESLGLAQIGICSFRRDQLKVEQVRYSAEIGLIGSSIELMMSSILIQALGKKVIFKDIKKGAYKTASEILSDFRTLLNQASPNTLFLVNGVKDIDLHFQKLLNHTNRFQIIIKSRANGLHNGYGLKYEIVASFFQNVSEFIRLVGLSNNFKPYLSKIPELIGIKIDKEILIDDLYQQLQSTMNIDEQSSLLSSLFLVLPEIPQDLPEWLDKFESIKIAPKKNDVVYLIDALEKANPVTLNKVSAQGRALKVNIVGKNIEGAIPISTQNLKSEFTQFNDQFMADIANANGRINDKQLDLPPKSSINYVFAEGLRELDILDKDNKFTAHQTWPFIVQALKVNSTITTFPYWFLVRETKDLGQLKSCLKRAQKLGNKALKQNISQALLGIESIETNKPVDSNIGFISAILKDVEKFSNELEKVERVYAKNGLNGLGSDFEIDFTNLFSEKITIGVLLHKILIDENVSVLSKKYWVAKLTPILPEAQDLPILAKILNDSGFDNSHTNIRKAFRAYDFNNFGPKVINT